MRYTVVAASMLRPYVLDVTFADGTQCQIDIEPELYGEMFEPMATPQVVGQVKVDPELGTIIWPNGADLSPEYLYAGGHDLDEDTPFTSHDGAGLPADPGAD